MRIIFLNTWNGETGKPLLDFIKEHSSDTDIFCFMEVELPLHRKISEILTDFDSDRVEKAYLKPVYYRVATFWKNNLKKLGKSEMFLGDKDPGMGFSTKYEINGKSLLVCNIHGPALPGTKVDTDERLKQSEIIINYANKHDGPSIIGGDFNLDYDTKSVAMFEEAGYRNLIKEFNVDSTRNRLSWEQFNNVQHFADFIFVSKDVKVNKFEVPKNEISDHLPLILDFDLTAGR